MSKASTLVSIGLPVYNGEPFIKDALESLVTQSYRNLEILISDNASTDGTAQICQEYASRDKRVSYHRHSDNIGLRNNFRHVLSLASGEFFMWACADDIRPPNSVETLVEALVNNQQAVMAHGPIILKIADRQVEVSNEMDLLHARAAKRVRVFTSKLQHNGMEYGLYRRGMFEKAAYGNHYGTEYLTSLQMCLLGPLEYVRVPMLIYKHEVEYAPTHDPMYRDLPVTMKTLREMVRPQGIRARKCRQVLIRGCYYLMRSPGTPLRDRVLGIAAYVWTFSWRFRVKLAKETVGVMFIPIFWIPKAIRKGLQELLSVVTVPRDSRL